MIEALLLQLTQLAPKAAAAVAIFSFFWIAAVALRKLLARIGSRLEQGRGQVIGLLGQALKAVLLIIGTISALGTLGIDVTAMVAGLGLTGFALGFALKDALSNLLAGVLILLYRPLAHGDHIEVAGYRGSVIGIDLRYTTLQQEDAKILIPNSVLYTNTVVLHARQTESA